MANPKQRDDPERQRPPEKIGKRYQFTKEDLEKALEAKRKSGNYGGGAAQKRNISKRHAGEVAELLAAGIDRENVVDALDRLLSPDDAKQMYPQALQALQDGLESENWRERFECAKLLLAYFWGRPTQQVVRDEQVRVMFDSPALKHVAANGG